MKFAGNFNQDFIIVSDIEERYTIRQTFKHSRQKSTTAVRVGPTHEHGDCEEIEVDAEPTQAPRASLRHTFWKFVLVVIRGLVAADRDRARSGARRLGGQTKPPASRCQ